MPQWLEYLDSLEGSGIRPGLARMRAVLRELGHPERAYRSIIVAGSNGKGSTSAVLASILGQAGYRTAHYTSPHLVDIRERWGVDGKPLPDDVMQKATDELRKAAETVEIVPTYFEALTLLAFIAFRIAGCEVAVLEVGMGGRLDATNVVRPIASVIAPVGFDHREFLGNTIRQIAGEKAGVIHRGSIALTSNDDPEVLDVLRKRAARFDSELIVVRGEHDTPLAGAFQRRNAALAVRTAEELGTLLPRITRDAIERGVAATRWRGRLERLSVRGKDVWIDGCHNAHAAAAVAPFLQRTVPRPRLLVFGIMADKDIAEVAAILLPLFDSVITTEPFPPRSADAETLAQLARNMNVPAAAEPDPEAAFARALQSDSLAVVVAGSLYLAGSAIAFFDSLSE